ncbi:MAG TPA: hypothetical protein VF638_14230 [Sphingomonas sp.]
MTDDLLSRAEMLTLVTGCTTREQISAAAAAAGLTVGAKKVRLIYETANEMWRNGEPIRHFRTLGGHVTFIDTPKPISKRKARRLRGRAA